MGSTHALFGMLLGSTILLWQPELLLPVGLAAFIGGLFPDLDMPFDHRETLHYPVQFWFVAVIALVYAVLSPGIYTVSMFYFVLAAAVHSTSDILGGGLEEKPWKMSADRAVYDHFNEKWWSPRYFIRYDGSPEDLLLTILFGAACYLIYSPNYTALIGFTVLISAIYAAVRKRIVDWAPDWVKDLL